MKLLGSFTGKFLENSHFVNDGFEKKRKDEPRKFCKSSEITNFLRETLPSKIRYLGSCTETAHDGFEKKRKDEPRKFFESSEITNFLRERLPSKIRYLASLTSR